MCNWKCFLEQPSPLIFMKDRMSPNWGINKADDHTKNSCLYEFLLFKALPKKLIGILSYLKFFFI